MCGRYYIDLGAFRLLGQRYDQEETLKAVNAGDVHPGDDALIIMQGIQGPQLTLMNWGLPLGKRLLINVRSESVLEKDFFHQMIHHQRCVIPARKFYEWTADKQKVTFSLPRQKMMYMAGVYDDHDGQPRYMIMTTAANDSVKNVHHRMPVLIDGSDVGRYLEDGDGFIDVMHKSMPSLKSTEYSVQMRLPL
ncbi:MAG: SOS response-associated peptidase family protein [Erysipelotrichaceae bacterium]|nr:SOS response-associated peptidase family protein [Erysipelotrichaceae bacterium]